MNSDNVCGSSAGDNDAARTARILPLMTIQLVSYGRKVGKGTPPHAALVYNCEQIPNPSSASRRGRTGLDKRLRDEVLVHPTSQLLVQQATAAILEHIRVMMTVAESTIETDENEAKNEDASSGESKNKDETTKLTAAFGCAHGKHRSVSIAVEVASTLAKEECVRFGSVAVELVHRDLASNPRHTKGKQKPERDWRCDENLGGY